MSARVAGVELVGTAQRRRPPKSVVLDSSLSLIPAIFLTQYASFGVSPLPCANVTCEHPKGRRNWRLLARAPSPSALCRRRKRETGCPRPSVCPSVPSAAPSFPRSDPPYRCSTPPCTVAGARWTEPHRLHIECSQVIPFCFYGALGILCASSDF